MGETSDVVRKRGDPGVPVWTSVELAVLVAVTVDGFNYSIGKGGIYVVGSV